MTPKFAFLALALLPWLAHAQTNLRAIHANGQTFLVWTDNLALKSGETYDIHVSSKASPTTMADFRLVGRVFPEEFRAARLKEAGNDLRWSIPNGSGGLTTLAANEGLFVYTPHAAGKESFIVLKNGNTTVAAGNRLLGVDQKLDSVTCYAQNQGKTANNDAFTDYAFWLDGQADENSGRADFPVMGNQHFNGVPAIFRVYTPPTGLPAGPVPALIFLHGNHGKWLNKKPEAEGWDTRMPQGLFVTFDDGVFVQQTDAAGQRGMTMEFTRWIGYWKGFDRFNAKVGVLPPNDGVVVDYTIRRNAWIAQWLVKNLNADPKRIILSGHSQGGSGSSCNVRSRPEIYSAYFATSGTISTFRSNLTDEMQGSATQNLATNLKGPDGKTVGLNDLYHPTRMASANEPALMRFVWGVNDDVVEWGSGDSRDKGPAINQLAGLPLGAHTYWDERGHEMSQWTPGKHHWVGSTRHSGVYLSRFRNDQSYPAFWNDVAPDNDPSLATAFVEGGKDWGTRNGYFEWDVDTLTDTSSAWSCVMYLMNGSSVANDNCPSETATANVTIRRAQNFKPAAGSQVAWKFVEGSNVLQSGNLTVGADGLVTVPNLTLYRSKKGRLAIGAGGGATSAPKTHVVTVNADGSFTPARVDIASGDTVEWRFSERTDTILPIASPNDCASFRPYNSSDTNEFTGPLPRAASGIFTLSPEETPYVTKDETWRNPQFTGVFIRPRWDEVHLGPGQFDWRAIDAEIAKAVANGKVFSLGFKAGVKGTPAWIFDPAKTDTPVTKLDMGLKSDGKTAYFGSPADANFRKHYFDLLKAAAAHLRERNAHYRALAYIKPSGMNLHTHENRLPNDTTEQHETWAKLGKYTPSALYDFYAQQEALLAAEFPSKDMGYALIQDGFPRINDKGEYLGQVPAPTSPLPAGSEQTEKILNQGRMAHGLRFVVAHNGLMKKPEVCPGSGVHPIVVNPNFHYVGSGCPNRWVLEQAALGQVTGYQTTNDLATAADVDSALLNAWDNSDGIYVELYERNAETAAAAGKLPSGQTIGQWADRFHERRRTNFPTLGDPFPLVHRHTFARTAQGSDPQLLYYAHGSKCSAAKVGTIAILANGSSSGGNNNGGSSGPGGAGQALGLRGWHANGQTWLTWIEEAGLKQTDSYSVYVSSNKPATLADMTMIGRLLPGDWRGTRLKRAGDDLRWQIPDGKGGLYRLQPGEAVFAYTPHTAASEYFAVVRHGTTLIGTGNLVGPIGQTLDPILPYPQNAGVINGHPFTDFALWVDGRADHASGRSGFPVMANHLLNGVAHMFRVYEPRVAPSSPRPAVFFHHGGGGVWTGQKPDQAGGVDLTPGDGYLVTLDDNLIVLYPDRVEEHEATKWFGYWEKFDRFDTARKEPPPGSLLVSYTMRRNAWIAEWVRGKYTIDPERMILSGHSMGASGGNTNLRYRPDLWSCGLLFNGSTIVTTPDDTPFLLGVAEDNLPTDLGMGITDAYHPWQRIVAGQDIPLQTLIWGVNDPTSQWLSNRPAGGAKPEAIAQLSANRVGALVFWDERDHGFDDAGGHWAGIPNQNIKGTPRHSADFAMRFRRNQSFPAFSNDTHSKSNANLATPTLNGPRDDDPGDWGTHGGYYDWDVATIEDAPTKWAVTAWMISQSTAAVDISPDNQAVADVSIRRAQQFRPGPGATVNWTFVRTRDGAKLQSGSALVDATGLVTVPRLTFFKEPTRLEIVWPNAPTQTLSISAVKVDGTGAHVTVNHGGRPFTLESSEDLKAWQILRAVTPASNPQVVDDPTLGLAKRFYRAR